MANTGMRNGTLRAMAHNKDGLITLKRRKRMPSTKLVNTRIRFLIRNILKVNGKRSGRDIRTIGKSIGKRKSPAISIIL